MIQRRTLVKAVIAALAPLSMTSAFAAGGPSGAHIGRPYRLPAPRPTWRRGHESVQDRPAYSDHP